MNRWLLIRLFGLVAFFGILTLVSCKEDTSGKGYLSGKVTVGPLCPVEHNPPDSSCLPTAATYRAYPVGIWSANGKTRISPITPDPPGGAYLLALAPGTYRVVYEQSQPGSRSGNLPVTVTISPGDTTQLDIEIDTGIR